MSDNVLEEAAEEVEEMFERDSSGDGTFVGGPVEIVSPAEVRAQWGSIDLRPVGAGTERAEGLRDMYAGKAPISGLTSKYDLIINIAQVVGGMQPVERVSWPASKGTPDLPWYVHELPTMLISFSTPFLLADAPAQRSAAIHLDRLM